MGCVQRLGGRAVVVLLRGGSGVANSVTHPVRITAERRDALLDPHKPGALVLHAVVAGAVARVPRPERVERGNTEHPEPDLRVCVRFVGVCVCVCVYVCVCDTEAQARARPKRSDCKR